MMNSFILFIFLSSITLSYSFHSHLQNFNYGQRLSTLASTSASFNGMRTSLDDFDQIIESIVVFKKVFKDVRIPLKFEVPSESPWPFHLHGLRLGKRLEKILSTSDFFEQHNKDKVAKLEDLGFKADLSSLADDWDVIYDALLAYHRIFGDLRVSVKYTVPDEEPWPRLSRNLKLGLRVASMRSAGRYVKDHPERKAQLDELGFEWRIREHTHKQQIDDDIFDKIYDGLKIYKDLYDDIDSMPIDFSIPEFSSQWPESLWNLKLGIHYQAIRDNDKYFFNNGEKTKKLADLGIETIKKSDRANYTQRRFEMVYDALVVYKQLYKDVMVPQVFCVPAEAPWPEHTWDLKLGVRVSAIRCQGVLIANHSERKEKLTQLGFVWDITTTTSSKKRKSTTSDSTGSGNDSDHQQLGEELHFNSEEERMIHIEKEKRVEENLAKRKLALSLQKQEEKASTASAKLSKAAAIAAAAFQPDSSTTGGSSGTGSTHSTTNTNNMETIISENTRPFRSNANFEFSKMFEPSTYREIAAESIREYMQDREYSNDPHIRQIAHFEGHLTAQEFNHAIAYAIDDDDIQAMKSIGYRIMEFGKFNWNKVVKAMEIYKAHYGHLNVPIDYEITEEIITNMAIEVANRNVNDSNSNDNSSGYDGDYESNSSLILPTTTSTAALLPTSLPCFDESFEELKLGEAVYSIRTGDVDGLEDPVRKQILDDLGFNWYDEEHQEEISCFYQRYRFVPMLIGLRLYKHLYGFAMPQSDFRVPDEPQWPYWMANMPLGEWTAAARIQQKMIQLRYPDRKDLLDVLNFQWWVPPKSSLPMKYYMPLPTVSQVSSLPQQQ